MKSGGYPNGLRSGWGAGNEDGMLASSLQSTTTLHGLSAQPNTYTTRYLTTIKTYRLMKVQSGAGKLAHALKQH